MNTKNVDTILDLDPRAPYSKDQANEELMLYKPYNSDVMNIVKMNKNEDRSYNFTYCEMSGEETDEDPNI